MTDGPSNNDRAEAAETGLLAFAEETGLISDRNHEEPETIISDFLCNLRHYCRRENIDVEKIFAESKDSFEEELEEEARESEEEE